MADKESKRKVIEHILRQANIHNLSFTNSNIIHTVVKNDGQCPCIPKYLHNNDTICPCSHMRNNGKCHCGLFENT